MPQEFAGADLLAYYPEQDTVVGLEKRRGVIIKRTSQPTAVREIVLVKTQGQIMLAYAADLEGRTVRTAQRFQFDVQEFIGVFAFEIPRTAQDLLAPDDVFQ